MAEINGSRRGPGRPFPPGVSGNPGGRPHGFAAKVRAATAEGQEPLEVVLRILRGQLMAKAFVGQEAREVEVPPTIRERFDAARWLVERGYGRAPEMEDDDPLAKMTDEQLLDVVRDEILKRKEGVSGDAH